MLVIVLCEFIKSFTYFSILMQMDVVVDDVFNLSDIFLHTIHAGL